MINGLAPSTSCTYATAQRKFSQFSSQLGNLHPSRSTCLADEWPDPSIILLSRSISQALGPFILSKDIRTPYWIACILNMSYKGQNAHRAQHLPLAYLSLTTLCWLLGNLWTWTFHIILCSGKHAPLVTLVSCMPRSLQLLTWAVSPSPCTSPAHSQIGLYFVIYHEYSQFKINLNFLHSAIIQEFYYCWSCYGQIDERAG